MKIADMDLREMLSFNPEGGIIHLLGERVLIHNANVSGLLKKELIDSLGVFTARCILTRLGFANGWQTAKNLEQHAPDVWKESRKYAGAKLHSLTGFNNVTLNTRTDGSDGKPLIESVWHDCYEAEQHLLHFGRSEEPACWREVAFASGFASYVEGREVYFIEDQCRAMGHDTCHVTARYKEDWGPELEPYLRYYRMESSAAIMRELNEKLISVEKRLRKKEEHFAFLEGATTPTLVMSRSRAMKNVVDMAWRVAKVDSSVLVTGESGSGKELMARFIHDQSPRAAQPFIAVNCGALTETLLESELFGHAKGSFTGADRDRPGLFEAAAGGTLFLDEIGEVSPAMQVKLLRALQEREVRRVGENKSRKIDVRVVTATNRNLADEIAQGRFRQDLYYRLRVIELQVPPLRERNEDILPLTRMFLAKLVKQMKLQITGFTSKAAAQFLRYSWPGNVRELQNAVEYAVAMCQGAQIDVDDLPCDLRALSLRPVVSDCIRPLEEIERDYIIGVLRALGGNKVLAASELNIGLATLYRKLKEYEAQGAISLDELGSQTGSTPSAKCKSQRPEPA